MAELTAGLIWPRLLRAAGLSLSPPRLVIGFAVALVIGVWSWLIDALCRAVDVEPFALPALRGVGSDLHAAAASIFHLAPVEGLGLLYRGVFADVADAVSSSPLLGTLWVVVALGVWAVGVGAIARSVAVDVAGDLSLGIRGSMAFSLKRWRSMVFAVLIPLIVVGIVAAVLMVAGWATLSLKGVSVVGGLLFGPALLIGLALVFVLAVFVIGHAMLAPAVAVESTDAADAVQRAYAYVLGRPGRMLVYTLVLIVQGAVALLIIDFIIGSAWHATRGLTAFWLSDERAMAIFGPEATGPTARIVRGWLALLTLIPAAWAVTYWSAAGTLLYLLLRRVNDEQDIREVWMPGMIPGALAGPEPAGSDERPSGAPDEDGGG